MQDTLLRMLVLALGLLTMDDPRIEERDDITTMGLQELEEMLLRGREKLDHEMVPVSEETAHTDSRGPWDDQHDTEEDKMSVLEDVTITKQDSKEDDRDSQGGEHFVANLDPQNPKSEPETTLKTTQIDQEQNRNLQLDMKSKEGEDIQTDSTFRDPSRQGQQENPVGKEVKKKTCATYFHKGRARLLCISEHGTLEMPHDDWEYLWYIWNTLSIIFMVRFFRKYLRRNSQVKLEETRVLPVKCRAAEVPLPDSDTLQRFYSKCIQVSSDNKWKDFLEGFANDLLEAMRTVCDRNDSMVIEDFQVVDGCDIIIPFNPPDPFSFQCLLWNNQASDVLPDMQACGQIKLVENKKIQTGCPCQSPNSDDMVCLLHCESEKVKTKITDAHNGLLCMKNSPFLSKSQVTRWFQSTIKQAWDQISHKYEFELNIRYVSAPGALVVRFRSGKKIIFNMNPVVEVCTDAHFFITPCSPNNLDTFWTLSLTNYEDRFLENISKHLPKNACHSQTLEIAHFLHKRQTALSGRSELKEFHFKIALMHLLLTKDPSQWKPSHVACRLRDLLAFMEKSLEKKLLHHVLIGNPLTQSIIELPAEFTQAKTVNLFHPLVVHNCIYRDTVTHFQEMLRNAHMLIQDYVECSDSCSI
ncbi:inositol 1,4,5-trisphosphate receptor-interacting protein [Plectropomus leopardus]|uniref:inositol 1,4,5-trisphosphate receptor-interacting protein n=1 Tax=Plectropomus leopardus TaxID=160734 RepID=UPI001C4AD247|nr:inositol 1,4,5-trisphosphate receptor-interacting protein [Plectropomus leopardus]XP_042340560.1 inositol 1,4,5-trisphosphate receptor-interacting protein [Plectropomus leopardus]